jgi:hypothetical protein
MAELTLKERIRAQRQEALDRLIARAESDQRMARTIACMGVRLYAEGEVSAESVLEDVDDLRKATVRVELLKSMSVLDLEDER